MDTMSLFTFNVNVLSRVKQHHFYALLIHDLTVLVRSIAHSERNDTTRWQYQILLVNEIVQTLSVRIEDLIVRDQNIFENDRTQQIIDDFVDKDAFVKEYVRNSIHTNIEFYFKDDIVIDS